MTNTITVKDLIDIMPDFTEEWDVVKIIKISPPSTDRELLYQGHIVDIYDEALLQFKVTSISIDYGDTFDTFLRILVVD
jgi:hypothetical protein